MINGIISAAGGADFDLSKYFDWFNSDYSIGDAALIALMGILFVLLVLVVLVVLLVVFNKVFGLIEKKATSAEKKKASKEDSGVSDMSSASENDEEVVAAITAAISCIYAEESGASQPPLFTVRRIRQVKNSK